MSDSPPDRSGPDFQEIREAFLASLVAVSDFVRVDRVLGAQVPAGRAAFFGTQQPEDPSAARANRFLEWFALERRADGSGGPPIQAFLAAGSPGLAPELRPYAEAWAASRPGVWAIRDAEDGVLEIESAYTEELQSLWLPEDQTKARIGQTVAGRLVQVPGSDRLLATDATALFPGTQLFDAFVEEIERRKLRLGDEAVEPSQLELEQILVAYEDASGESPDAVESELDAFLRSGLEPHEQEAAGLPRLEDLSYALSVSSSPGQVIGPYLEALAFTTQLDIETAQRLLLRLWNAHQMAARGEGGGGENAPETPTVPSTATAEVAAPPRVRPEELGPKLAREIEQGLAEGEDVEVLFGRIESMIDAPDPTPSSEIPEELRWHTQDEGDFEPLVEEYLWERHQGAHPPSDAHDARLREVVQRLQQRGVRSLEDLHEAQVAASLVEDWAQGSIDECIARLDALAAWNEWLLACQELTIDFDPAAFRDRLRAARDRCETLRRALEGADASDAAPTHWRVVEFSDARFRLKSATRELELDATHDFEIGDLVLGVVLDPDAAAPRFARGVRLVPALLAPSTNGS